MARRRAASRRPVLARRASAAALAVVAVAFLLGRALPFPSPSSAVSFRFAAAQPITYADLLSNLPDSKSPKIDDEKPAAAAAAKPAASSKFATGDELVPKARAAAAGSETAAASTTAARSDGNAGAAASRAGTSAAEDLAAKRNAGGQDKLAPIGGSALVAAAPAPAAPTPAGAPAPPPPPPPPSDPKSLALAAATAAARGEARPAAPAGPALGAVSAGGGPGVAAAGTLVGAAAAREAPSAPAAGNLPVAGAGAAAAGVAPRGGVALPNGMTVLTKADADALLSLRDAVANWDELVGWGLKGWSPNSNPCAGWTGVSCSNAKRVIGVDLSGWMVKGTLPAELALLDELRTFNASDCDLTGGLPIGWAANGAFPRLSVLDLSNNARLAAEVPGEWGDARAFPSLTVLALRNAGLAAPLNEAWPASRAAMAKLATLDLSGNAIRGVLPPAFGSGGTLTKLRTLLLNNNSIAGTLPKEWGSDNETLPSLSVLDLSCNVLEGRLPKPWGSNGGFSQLTELHLQVNRLAGSLPTEWGQGGRFPRLAWLDVYGNRLAGPVPDSWGRRGGGVSRLTTLSLRPGNAKLCGKVPLQLRNAAVGERAAPLGPAPLGACPAPVPSPEPPEAPPADAVSPVDDPAELDEAIAGSPAGAPLPPRKPRKKAPAVPAAALVDPDFDEWFFPEDEGDAGGAAGVAKAPAAGDEASPLIAGAPSSAPAVQMQRIKVGDFDIVVPALGSADKPLFRPPPEAFAAAPAPAAPKAADREPVSSHGKRKRGAAGAPAPSPAGPPAPPPLPIMTPVKVAFVEATFNFTGLNLDVANATLRRGAERAMRRALGGSGGGGEDGGSGGGGNGPNVTLLALRDVLPDGTVDVSTALPPLPDQGSLADVDPALAAADKALRAKARADKEAESVGFRRRLAFASSSGRSLNQATADDTAPSRTASPRGKAGIEDAKPAPAGAAGIENTVAAPAPPAAPASKSKGVKGAAAADDTVSAAVRTARAAAAAVAAATGGPLSAEFGGDGKTPGGAAAAEKKAEVPAEDERASSPAPMKRNTIQATYLLSTTPGDVLGAVSRFNESGLADSLKKELARVGVRNVRVRLAAVGQVGPDGAVIPAEKLRKPAPPPGAAAALAAEAAATEGASKQKKAGAAGAVVGVLLALSAAGGAAGFVVVKRRREAAAAAEAEAAAKTAAKGGDDGGEGGKGGSGFSSKGGKLPTGLPDAAALEAPTPGKKMLDAALEKVRASRTADSAASMREAAAATAAASAAALTTAASVGAGSRRVAPGSGPASTAGSSSTSSGEGIGGAARRPPAPPVRQGSLQRNRSGEGLPASASARQLQALMLASGGGAGGQQQRPRSSPAAGAAAANGQGMRRSPSSSNALALANGSGGGGRRPLAPGSLAIPGAGGGTSLATLTAPGGPLAALARELSATEASMRAGGGGGGLQRAASAGGGGGAGLARTSSGVSSSLSSALGRSGGSGGGEGMSTMLRELRALEAGVGGPPAAGARPGSAPQAGGNQAVLLRSLDDATAVRAVARAGSRDGIARATSRETLLRDLERDLGIAAHPRMERGAPAGALGPSSSALALAALGGRPGSAGGSVLPPPVRPGGDDGAAALARASALLADMSNAAPSRLERQNSRGDLRR